MLRQRRELGIAKRRSRMPRQRWPQVIYREYLRNLMMILDDVRALLAPLLDQLPRLTEAAAAVRKDDVDHEGMRSLIEIAREKMRRQLSTSALDQLARQFADRTGKFQKDQLMRQARAALGVDIFIGDRKLRASVDAFAAENVALIRTLGESTFADIEMMSTRALTTGVRHEDLAKQIQAKFGNSANRAKLIARDQIGKLYGQVNADRQKELGLTSFVWRTVGDERVRDEHAALEGKTFKYDDPPDGELPGEPINCRCSAEPDFSGILDGAKG